MTTESAHDQKAVLVVEDEPVTALELERTLVSFGYRVRVVDGSGDVIRAAESERFDVVLMDVKLAGGVDGIETAENLRRRVNVPVVYLTASTDGEIMARAKDTAPYGYLIKPVKSVTLRSAVEVALQRHRSEQRVHERWFTAVLRSVGEGVVATGTDGRVSFMNRIAETLTQWSAGEAFGRPIEEVFCVATERSDASVEAVAEANANVSSTEAVLIRRDGSRLAIDRTLAPVHDDDGRPLGAVLVFRDATERRRMQSDLLVSDRMASIGLVAAGVAHEMNNPLAVVTANLEFVLKVLATDDVAPNDVRVAREALTDATSASKRIRNIVADLRVFSRPGEEKRKRLDVRRVLDATMRLAWNDIRHRARVTREFEEVPAVFASESRLGQVFANLLVNASQAIPVGRAEENEIRVSTGTDAQGRAVITISDTGGGIAPEVLDRVYQPFFTTKPAATGTGLGLYLCRRILDGIGGTIDIASEPGKGTRVHVVLPAADDAPVLDAPPPDAPTAQRTSSSAPGRARILVVDDEEGMVNALQRILERHHDLVCCSSGEACLALLAKGERFDVVLCDVMMPQMTGMEVHERLNRTDAHHAARLVFMTGGAFTPATREFLESSGCRMIEKPFSADEALRVIDDVIQSAHVSAT